MAKFSPTRLLTHGFLLLTPLVLSSAIASSLPDKRSAGETSVLILGGGVAGVIAARTLHEHGITKFTIVEAHGEFPRASCATYTDCILAFRLSARRTRGPTTLGEVRSTWEASDA